MFDLFRSRAKAVRYLLTFMLSMVALSMVITLIPGVGSSTGQRNDQIIAEIGDDVLTARTVNMAIQGQIRERNMSRETVELVAPQFIDQMVGEMASAYYARKMGFTVSEEELATGIRTMFPQLFQGGQFVGAEVYRQVLMQMNTTIPEFEAQVRKQLLLSKLQAIVFQGVVVSPKEVEAEYQKRHEKVKLALVKLDPEDYKSQVKPTQAELEAYVKANQARFFVPEKRDVAVLAVDEAKLGEGIPVDDAALRRLYESQKDRFRVEERAQVRHILVKADVTTAAEDKAKAKAKAEDLLKQIKAGGNFEELAKKNSDDPGSATKGGDLGFFVREQMVKPFADAAFALKPNETSGIVETQFGYHIIRGIEHQPGRLKPFEEVKTELATEARRAQLYEKMPALAEQAHAELAKNPGQAEELAKKLNLVYEKGVKIAPRDPLPIAGTNQEFQMMVMQTAKGGVTPVFQAPGNKLLVAVVTDVQPSRPATLADMEKDIRDAYISIKAGELSEAKANQLLSKVRDNNNNDLEKAAKEVGVKLTITNEFERTGQIEGVGPGAYFGEQPFMNPVGHVVGIYRVARTAYLFKILSKTAADVKQMGADREAIVSAIRERKLRERRDLFEEGLVRRLKEEGDVKVNNEAIKRLVAAYRG
jgi:peptidyl-prolyl cis-trans isomerase D